jgi:hypothetical protein
MRVNIKKLAGGGGFTSATYYTETMPTPTTPAQGATGAATPSGTSSLLDDDTFKELLTKGGLVNDVNSLVNDLVQLESRNTNPFVSSNNRGVALQMIKRVNELRESKNLWKESMDNAKASGGLGEVAVGTSGEVYIKNKDNKVQAIGLDDYNKNREGVRLLSVAELLKERNYNPNETRNDELFNVANNSIGLAKINESIVSMINALGKESSETTSFQTKDWIKNKVAEIGGNLQGKEPTKAEIEALDSMQALINSPDARVKLQTKTESERNHIDKALNYIWKTIGAPAQQKLKAVAVMNGDENPINYIMDLLVSNTDYSSKTETTTDADPKTKGASGEGRQKPITTFELQNNSKMGMGTVRWNDSSTGLTMNLAGNQVSLWENAQNNTLLKMGQLGTLLDSHTGALLQQNKVYFGDKKTSLADRQNIIIDPNSGSARVYFPVNSNGEPDYDLMKTIDEVIKGAPQNLNPEQLTKYFADKGLSYVAFDKNFEIKPHVNFKPFLLLYGYADEKSGATKGNNEIKELEGDDSGEIEDVLLGVWKKDKIATPTGLWNWSNTFYKGNILIPYQEDAPAIASSLVGNITDTQSTLQDVKTHKEVSNARVVTPSSSIFYK